ncbi:translocation protein sec62-like [Teratosphaeria destructans]|uniref:Translocation protein SEC62 n=1 Tax=Teratosphaeria destructans TaxID=418781 RepID=A0A9W7SZZ1_9PEZI|nr:translocation protein sec62-like [Teratosphaeria destructans]
MAQPGQMPPGAGRGMPMSMPLPGGPLRPGQQPSPEQIQAMQRQIAAEAQKAGLTVPQYIERIKAQAMQQQQLRMQQQQQQAQQGGPPPGQVPVVNPNSPQAAQPGQQQPIQPGPPKPEALAVAKFLRGENLKMRTCIFQQQRKDMFKVKRAIRALHSDAYKKARAKDPLLPEVNDRVTAENTFKLLPMSLLALRVSKHDPHEGHDHGKKKRVKGLWTVKVEPQQEARDEFYYVWLWEGPQWKNRLYAIGALVLILAVVFFPIWPYHLRLGVWYLSMAMLGVLGLFFGMAIFRLILFLVTMFVKPPGLWLFPNLFEDVGFFDSFKPVWAWHEDEKTIKKRKKEERERKKARREAKASEKASSKSTDNKAKNAEEKPADTKQEVRESTPADTAGDTTESKAATTQSENASTGNVQQRSLSARVEEVEDD